MTFAKFKENTLLLKTFLFFSINDPCFPAEEVREAWVFSSACFLEVSYVEFFFTFADEEFTLSPNPTRNLILLESGICVMF